MSESEALDELPRRGFNFDWRRDIIYVGFVVVLLIFSVLLRDEGFLSVASFWNILRQAAIVSVVAVQCGDCYVAVPFRADTRHRGRIGARCDRWKR